MDLEAIGLAALGVVVVFGLTALARRWSSSVAIPVEIVVGDARTEVSVRGRLLLSEPSVIWYTTDNALGLPQLLNFSESRGHAGGELNEYRLADPGAEPAAAIVHAFLAGCLLLSRKQLGVTQMRPLQAKITLAISDPVARAKVEGEIRPHRFKAIGVPVVTVVEGAAETAGNVSR